jgi:hypothetical protein
VIVAASIEDMSPAEFTVKQKKSGGDEPVASRLNLLSRSRLQRNSPLDAELPSQHFFVIVFFLWFYVFWLLLATKYALI